MKTHSLIQTTLSATLLISSIAVASENHDLLKSVRPGVYQLTETVSGYCPQRVWPQMDSSVENFTLTDISGMNNTRVVFNNRMVIDGPDYEECWGIDFLDMCLTDDQHSRSYTDDQRIYNETYQTGIDFLENTHYEAYVEFNGDQIRWYDQGVEGSLIEPASKLEDPNECVFRFVSDH